MKNSDDNLQEYSLKDFRKELSQIIGNVSHGKNRRVKVTSYGRTAGYFVSEDEMNYLDSLAEIRELMEIEEEKNPKKRSLDEILKSLAEIGKRCNFEGLDLEKVRDLGKRTYEP